MNFSKKIMIKKIAKLIGFDIIRYKYSNEASLLKLLETHGIDLVIDLGANIGQYANTLLSLGYKGKILSVEPLSSAYIELLKASKNNPNWEIAERCAVGEFDGEVEINISKNSFSSSILPILCSHTYIESESKYISSEKVKIFKLNTLLADYTRQFQELFLKIDVQGYEKKVLDGASEVLCKIKGMQIELSLIPLYKDQFLFDDMLMIIKEMGFDLYSLFPILWDQTGRVLQVNATFFRR